jgi:hypothetical protein
MILDSSDLSVQSVFPLHRNLWSTHSPEPHWNSKSLQAQKQSWLMVKSLRRTVQTTARDNKSCPARC